MAHRMIVQCLAVSMPTGRDQATAGAIVCHLHVGHDGPHVGELAGVGLCEFPRVHDGDGRTVAAGAHADLPSTHAAREDRDEAERVRQARLRRWQTPAWKP